MKKFLVTIFCGSTLYCSAATYPNIVTNVIQNTNYIIANVIIVTNFFYQNSAAFTNGWTGPTNIINLDGGSDQTYFTFTPISVTGFSNKGTNLVKTVTLTLVNSAATNVTLTLNAAIETRDGLRQYTITNGQDYIISFRYHPLSNRTNSVNAVNF